VSYLVGKIAAALDIAFLMGWEILWALVLGFALSGVVQAVVTKGEMSRLLPDSRARTILIASGLGAASSSCSYAAIALARSRDAIGCPGTDGPKRNRLLVYAFGKQGQSVFVAI
jgi:uncharacterized membrane protein YraQ (UPF0718 family)